MNDHLQVGLITKAASFRLRFGQLNVRRIKPDRCRRRQPSTGKRPCYLPDSSFVAYRTLVPHQPLGEEVNL